MHYAIVFVLLLSFVFGLGLLARRLNIPYPILFVIGGLIIGFIPNLPPIKLDPDFIFFIFLPPLLYIQAFFTSWRDFRRELRAISLLAIGLVLATTVTVAFVSHWLIPDFPLAAGFALGAIISPPDAIAASAIARRLGLPRRVITIIEGESLVNDSTSLVILKIALIAVGLGTGHFFDMFASKIAAALAAIGMGTGHIIGNVWLPGYFFYVSVGGIAVGLAVGWMVNWLRYRIMEDGVQIVLTVSIMTPFVSYLAGELVHVSSVLAVVSTGLYLGWESPEVMTSTIRLQSRAVWEMIIYLLNGFIFVLIGLQLPGILRGLEQPWWPYPLLYAVVINFICIIVRLGWMYPGAYLPRLIKRIRDSEIKPEPREIFIVGWCGMRGMVSLAAALTITTYPKPFPKGHLIQFIAFSVILTTLVFQGLTLPFFIRYLGVGDDGSAAREELDARERMSEAALEKLAKHRREKKFPEPVLDNVEQIYRERAINLHDDLADQLGWSEHRQHQLSLRRLRRNMIATQRRALVDMRRSGLIGDDVLHKIEYELDIDEARYKSLT